MKRQGWCSGKLTVLIKKLNERHNESLCMASCQPLKKQELKQTPPCKENHPRQLPPDTYHKTISILCLLKRVVQGF